MVLLPLLPEELDEVPPREVPDELPPSEAPDELLPSEAPDELLPSEAPDELPLNEAPDELPPALDEPLVAAPELPPELPLPVDPLELCSPASRVAHRPFTQGKSPGQSVGSSHSRTPVGRAVGQHAPTQVVAIATRGTHRKRTASFQHRSVPAASPRASNLDGCDRDRAASAVRCRCRS